MWKQFITNNYHFSIGDTQFYRACLINALLLLISITLFLFSIYNVLVTNYYHLFLVEFTIFLLFIMVLLYFQRTSNLKITSYATLLLIYIFLAIYVAINKNLEYGLYWLSIFPTISIFLLGHKAGLLISLMFYGYFIIVMLDQYRFWEVSVFNTISIVNIVFTSAFIMLFTSYFDIILESAKQSLLKKAGELEEEHTMLDRYVIVYTIDLSGIIHYASKAFCNTSGYNKERLIGQNHSFIYEGNEPILFENMWNSLGEGKVWSGEVKSNKKDGSPYWLYLTIEPILDTKGKPISYRAIGTDVTYRKQIEKLAVFDYLTNLTNRAKLDEKLSKEIQRAVRYGIPLCVILLDIDHFKNVNDYYGHQKGDHVLKEIAHILKKNTREVDIVGRWGGEEFLIIVPSATLENSVSLAEKLRFKIENHDFGIDSQTASFGVARYQAGDEIDTLIGRVDKALYQAKKSGRNQVIKEKEKNDLIFI